MCRMSIAVGTNASLTGDSPASIVVDRALDALDAKWSSRSISGVMECPVPCHVRESW